MFSLEVSILLKGQGYEIMGLCEGLRGTYLEGTVRFKTEVFKLNGGECSQLDTQFGKMQSCDFFIESFGKHGDTNGPSFLGGPQLDLSEDLVGEGGGHDEGRVTRGTAEIDKSAFGKEDDVVAVGEEISVNLGFNVDDALGVLLEPCDVDFNIEMADVANDSIVLHDGEVVSRDDISTTGCGDEDVSLRSSLFHGEDFVSFKTSLKGIDGVDLGDEDARTHSLQCFGTSFADVTVSSDDTDLSTDHDICSTLDSVDQRFTTSV
jgi:hypothetical protein